VLLVFTAPFVQLARNGDLVELGMVTVVMISGVLAVSGRARTLLVAIVLALPVIATKWTSHYRPDLVPQGLLPSLAAAFILYLARVQLGYVLRTRQVDSEVICAAISVYLLMAVVWAFAYMTVAQLIPDSFGGSNGDETVHMRMGFAPFYFSVITLNTVGYGDIFPVSPFARMLAMMESTTGLFYIAVLISRLVAAYSARAGESGSSSS
jgi:voltage-gated potassium channel